MISTAPDEMRYARAVALPTGSRIAGLFAGAGLADAYRARNSALAVAFNDRCDAIVATAVVAHDRPAAIEPGVIEFLNSKTIVHWAEVTLGL